MTHEAAFSYPRNKLQLHSDGSKFHYMFWPSQFYFLIQFMNRKPFYEEIFFKKGMEIKETS
jgi:hypothetical protein